jgi:hypothetical protein
MGIAIVVFVLVGFITSGVYGYYTEKADWNNGKCCCGQDWRQFDMDSQGGRGYVCDCGRHIWISWPGIDKIKD